jgi:hypothetical protein
MALITLNFENKNQFRKYPFKQTSDLITVDGRTIPDDLIVNCSVTSTLGRHRLYIKQVCYNSGRVKIAITSLLDDVTLGVFEGLVSSDFTTLKLTPFVRFVSGTITIGSVNSLIALPKISNFESDQTELEESTVFCYIPPRVTSIVDKKGSSLRGEVNYGVLTNLTKLSSTSAKFTKFQASLPEAVFNLADKSSYLENCSTPLIKNINGVKPSTVSENIQENPQHENDGNIYIAGIRPIVFYGTQGNQIAWKGVWKDVVYLVNDAVTYEGVPYICIATTTAGLNQNPANIAHWQPVSGAGTVYVSTEALTLDSLCAQKSKLIPPVDVSGFTLPISDFKDKYYSKPALPAYNPENPDEFNPNYPLARPARRAGSFYFSSIPEYYFWPQFAKEEYYQNSKYWPQP